MNKLVRKQAVLSMEMMVRSINDEYIIDRWLSLGVADGDIQSFDVEQVDDCYTEDKTFKELMTLFLDLMIMAKKDGGLYIDKISSD
jgi:hypothetical protein